MHAAAVASPAAAVTVGHPYSEDPQHGDCHAHRQQKCVLNSCGRAPDTHGERALPRRSSVARSRRLLTTRIAVERAPTPTPASNASGGNARACTQNVPATATSPKNTNTNRSPSPR